MNSLKIGLIQMTSGEDVTQNIQQLISSYRKLKSEVSLVITPENTLFMRTSRATPMKSFSLESEEIKTLQNEVNAQGKALLLGSIPLQRTDMSKLTNAMVLLKPNQRPRAVYEKNHLFDVDVDGQPPVRESEVFVAGKGPEILEWEGFKIGLSICYDLRFSNLYLAYGKQAVDVIVIPSAFLVPTGEAHWHVLTRARAIESQAYVLAPAQGGRIETADGAFRETYGHSLAIDPWGQVKLELSSDNPTGVIEVRRDRIESVRAQIPMAKHRREL